MVILSIVSPGLFALGRLCTTPAVLLAVSAQEIAKAIRRHCEGDWGELDDDDKLVNNEALKRGGRLLSSYKTESGTTFWIITEANRSVTTVLLPEDY